MSMYTTIIESAKQFTFELIITNKEKLIMSDKYIVVGMGGSHLAADVLKLWQPESEILIHSNYGLPRISQEELYKRLIILSSYSGNTEEVIDAFVASQELGLAVAVITKGGKLLELAKSKQVPYIQLPPSDLQPRAALGLSILAFLKVMGQEEILKSLKESVRTWDPSEWEDEGRECAEELRGHIPVIYTSEENNILGYIWKINFNETGKIPAFNNTIPELNHNEMNGFDVSETTESLGRHFEFIFVKDEADRGEIKKRMEVTAQLYRERNLRVKELQLRGETKYTKFLNTWVLAQFTANFTAELYGSEAEAVPMIEEFKKML